MSKVIYKSITDNLLAAHQIFTPLLASLAALSTLVLLISPLPSQARPGPPLTDRQSIANVILFIGDGMDEHQITMARNYLYGPTESFAMEKMPVLSSVRIQTLREDNPKQYLHVADSANTASTLATGMLTSKGRIATAAVSNKAHKTILEEAQQNGYRTGLVSTASLTDATPAAFASHSPHRGCKSPKNMKTEYPFIPPTQQCTHNQKAQGGVGSIAEQLATANVDVLLGGGRHFFDQRVGGKALLKTTRSQGYTLLENTADLLAESGSDKLLLGLFSSKNLPVEWVGDDNRHAELITTNDEGGAVFPTPFGCQPNPLHAEQQTPSLTQMTKKALSVLSKNNTKGFFLMVEGASIDKQSHARNPCGQIGELRAFDQAVAKGREFAAKHPNTLVIVTADHGQAGQIIPLPESYQIASEAMHMPQYPTGYYAVLKTLSGELMGISYATNASPQGLWEMHTGTNVPAFMEGPGLDDVPITIDQRYIHGLMRRHLKLERPLQENP
ncbi:MAG: alkaline phosphatase [Porticoccus sp.]|nr:alkaline phosphatase [Porticoccus sp.]